MSKGRLLAIITILIQLCTITVYAKEPKDDNPNFLRKRNYYYYRFTEKWVFNVGLGGQVFSGENDSEKGIVERLKPAFSISANKQINEYFAFRGKLSGGQHLNTNLYYDIDFSSVGVSADGMLNVSRLISDIIPPESPRFWLFGGLGIEKSNETIKHKANGFSESTYPMFNAGLYAEIPFNNRMNFTAELRGSVVGERFDGEIGGIAYEGFGTLLFGVTYYFKKKDQ